MEAHLQQMGHMIHQSFLPHPYPPSTVSWKDLKKVYIKDLQLQIHHRGSFVLLKAATVATVMTAVMAIVEDEVGEGVVLQLYQQEGDNHRRADEVIRLGDVCIVKEPYFKVMNDGGYGLRVDHVSDIVWLAANDDVVPVAWRPRISELKDAEKLKEEGNAALKAGKLCEAVELYSQALEASTTAEESRVIKLNRSLANIRLGCYDQGLEDAGNLAPEKANSEKGFYRVARSLYELGRFQEACGALAALLAAYPNCQAAAQELIRTKRRLEEQERGDYDFHAMYNAAKATPPYMDLATYIGPVEIRSSEGRGRGLFTTRDVSAGELLLCEKAFAYCFADKVTKAASSRTSLLLNIHTKQGFMGTQADLITVIVRKLRQNPSLIPVYNSLHHGDYVPTLAQQEKEDKAYHTCGVFVHASHINHSCYSNVRRSFMGDMQIVRASRNLPTGSELFFWYVQPAHELNYDKTQEQLQHWGFKCTCVICEQSKKTKKAVISKRAVLLKDLKNAFEAKDGPDLPKCERILPLLEKTYSVSAANVPRLALWDPYLLLVRIYNTKNKPDKVVQTAWKVLESLGFVLNRNAADPKSPFEVVQWGLMQDYVVEAWVFLWAAFATIAPELCGKAEECAKTAYRICIGEDVTFDERYGKMAHQAIFEGLDLTQAVQTMKIGQPSF
ncbi:hypothetical protein P7C71_g2891, partial [Lecanoromycetidae sp. Uapishka_2]